MCHRFRWIWAWQVLGMLPRWYSLQSYKQSWQKDCKNSKSQCWLRNFRNPNDAIVRASICLSERYAWNPTAELDYDDKSSIVSNTMWHWTRRLALPSNAFWRSYLGVFNCHYSQTGPNRRGRGGCCVCNWDIENWINPLYFQARVHTWDQVYVRQCYLRKSCSWVRH